MTDTVRSDVVTVLDRSVLSGQNFRSTLMRTVTDASDCVPSHSRCATPTMVWLATLTWGASAQRLQLALTVASPRCSSNRPKEMCDLVFTPDREDFADKRAIDSRSLDIQQSAESNNCM